MRAREFIILEADLSTVSPSSWLGYLRGMVAGTVSIGKQGEIDQNLRLSKKSKEVIEKFINNLEKGADPKELAPIMKNTLLSFIDSKKTYYLRQVYKGAKLNIGEVAEGFHAAAAFARLIKRPSEMIDVNDVVSVIDKLKNNQTLVLKKSEVESDIADEFHLTVKLKPGSWEMLKNKETISRMGRIFDSIISDANSETSRFADRYATNQKYDLVRIIADGVSGETVTKTDIKFENETEKKFAEYSLKVGTTSQIAQVGGGARELGRDNTFDVLQNKLFNVDGKFPLADISAERSKFKRAKSDIRAYEIAYQAAVVSLNKNLQTDTKEKTFLKNLTGALKYWAVKDRPDIKLKQFTETGTMILDINKIDQMLTNNTLDLYAYYDERAQVPKIVISDRRSGKNLFIIRAKIEGSGYTRNYIEKGQLFIDLTLTKFVPNYPRPIQKVSANQPAQPNIANNTNQPSQQTTKQPSASQTKFSPKTTTSLQGTELTNPVSTGQFNRNVALEVSKIPMKSK